MTNFNTTAQDAYTRAIQTLVAQEYDISDIIRQNKEKETRNAPQPTDLDQLYPLTTPESWVPHFDIGASDPMENVPILSTSTLRMGGRFLLTPGQRATIRARYNLTPTKVVEITQLECYEGTRIIKDLVIKSDLHVPEHQRKHVLVCCRISDFGKWYSEAKAIDEEIEIESSNLDEEYGVKTKPATKPTKPSVLSQQILSQYI
jgi:hypothetical protein